MGSKSDTRVKLEVKSIFSSDLKNGELPADPRNCEVYVCADIGISRKKGSDTFTFKVVTFDFAMSQPQPFWAHHCLMVSEFAWSEIGEILGDLIESVDESTWEKCAREIGKKINWEFENYREGR